MCACLPPLIQKKYRQHLPVHVQDLLRSSKNSGTGLQITKYCPQVHPLFAKQQNIFLDIPGIFHQITSTMIYQRHAADFLFNGFWTIKDLAEC